MRACGCIGCLALLCLAGCPAGPSSGAGVDGGGPPVAGEPLGAPRVGVATWYEADGSGNCSFDASADLHVAAANDADYAGSALCGGCVRVKGPKGSTTVRVVDRCPDCGANHLDLSESAFAEIAEPRAGRVPVEWTPVACETRGPVSYHFKDGSSEWWTAIQVRNHRLPVRSFSVQLGGSWREVRRELYNYFVLPQGIGGGRHSIRLVGAGGQTLEDTLGEVGDDVTVPGTVQFGR